MEAVYEWACTCLPCLCCPHYIFMSLTSSVESSSSTNSAIRQQTIAMGQNWLQITWWGCFVLPWFGFIYILKSFISHAHLNAFFGLFRSKIEWIKVTGKWIFGTVSNKQWIVSLSVYLQYMRSSHIISDCVHHLAVFCIQLLILMLMVLSVNNSSSCFVANRIRFCDEV
jgi:hypothetical protein